MHIHTYIHIVCVRMYVCTHVYGLIDVHNMSVASIRLLSKCDCKTICRHFKFLSRITVLQFEYNVQE